MNQAAQDKLRELRQRLADLEPYPWEPVEAWIASAKPLVKAEYREHFKGFKAITAQPDWYEGIYVIPSRYSEYRSDPNAETAAAEDRENRKSAKAAKKKILSFLDGLLDLPAKLDLDSPHARPPAPIIHHHHGETHMGDKFTTNITGSTVGAFAQGTGAVATGHVTVGATGTLTQAQHLEHIKNAKKALADDEERLTATVYEALERFLKQAREVQVEPRPIDEVQAEIVSILDRVWVEHSGKALPQGLQVTETLAKSPAMVGATKKLLGA